MKSIIFFFLFIFFLPLVFGIGGGPSFYRVPYEPGFEGDYVHKVFNQNKGTGYIEITGELAPYIFGLPEEIDLNNANTIEYHVKLPDEPLHIYGMKYAKIKVIEEVENQGGVVARTAIAFYFQVDFPYPGLYLDLGISTNDVNENETILTAVSMTSRGNQTIDNGRLQITIEDSDGKILSTENVENIYLETNVGKSIEKKFQTKGFPPGKYISKAVFDYDTIHIVKEDEFQIGTYNIKLLNHSESIIKDEISKFTVKILSKWKGELDEVYAIVNLNGIDYKSASKKLSSFGVANLESFIDATGMDLGTHNATLTIYYNERKKTFPITINVIEKPIPETENPEETGGFTVTLNGTSILVVLVIILIIFNVYVLKKKHKKNEKKKK